MKKYQGWWTKERVDNGLRRFIRDYYEGSEANLPWTIGTYKEAMPVERMREIQQFRLYPSADVVARHYESMIVAWRSLGYEVQERALIYWTREKVIEGLKKFYDDFGLCPTEHKKYIQKSQFSPRFKKNGVRSDAGAYGKYPSFYGIRRYFGSMREAWTAAGFDVNQWWEPWSPLEDWFILESVGVLPRQEVSELLKRTVPAIKRRIYDLGRRNSLNRWGLTIHSAGRLLGLGGHVIQKYLEYGFIPYFRGNKCFYINPADLLEIKEFDWANQKLPKDVESLIRRSLIQRALKIIKFGTEWRTHEIYKFQKTKDYLSKRIKNPRKSAFADKLPDRPNDLRIGDWVILKVRVRQVEENRRGIIKGIYYSPQKHSRPDGTKRTCWLASVEFPKIKRLHKNGENRIRYNLPLDSLHPSTKPELEPIPLKMTSEAIRSRNRRTQYDRRAAEKFEDIKTQIT